MALAEEWETMTCLLYTSINYNNSFRFNSPVNLPEMIDAYTVANYFNEAARNGQDLSLIHI